MQVSIVSAVPSSLRDAVAKQVKPLSGASEATGAMPTPSVDFSHITPRQLLAYIDSRIFSNSIDPDEATSIVNQLDTNQMDVAPDVPFDLRARINGTMEFHMGRDDVLASWYAGLAKRLDDMEAQSLGFSAVA